MDKYSIKIASVPDKEKLVAEIWYNNKMIAEISNENKAFEIQFYLEKFEILNYDLFVSALNEAKEKLN